ncbi:MAG: non-lysosomal glucosylceramidase [Acidobacteria bacterium]|nr:non-lysosomal glucosylceramidase [Acidobacteriota bacterium]
MPGGLPLNRRQLFLGAAAAGLAPDAPGAPDAAVGRRFTGQSLREIAFPLGGIGTGTVSLGGYGNLRDWEIFNRPNKGGLLPFTFAALRIAGKGLKTPRIRVLEREVLPPYGSSHGIGRERAAGMPRFREAAFVGAYPFASVFFEDSRSPVEVSLEAFNPMVPLDMAASSLPVAVLAYTTRSRADFDLEATLAFSLMNPIGWNGRVPIANRRAPFFGQNLNEFRRHGLFLSSAKYPPSSPLYGSLALVTDADDVSYRLQWEHGAWWDELQAWWRDFTAAGRFPNGAPKRTEDGYTEYASLGAHFRLRAGESRTITFVLAWHFPNVEDYWTGQKPYYIRQPKDVRVFVNDYGTRWESAWGPAQHVLQNLPELRERSRRFRDTLYSSTLAPEVIDAVSSQVSTLRTNTLLVGAGGVALGFEGCGDQEGCCPMNCTHVYNYAQAAAHIYPALERSMRETDFGANLREDGYMSFRTATPVQHGAYTKIPAADGQMGSILKLYREWRLGAGDEWLRRLWPQARKAMEFARARWDPDGDGVMDGEQHNTYDVRFRGPNTMIGTLYLGALAAAAQMARHLGDTDAATVYEEVLQRGRRNLDSMLWNGRYYVQKSGGDQHWQFGEGCLSDQLLGQWFAELVDLGELLPREHVRQALRSVYRYNFVEDLREVPSGQRIYALNDEAGLVVCTWPDGKRPAVPFGYCDEVWSGVEYQVAAHLIYEGMTDEALRIVRAVRDRHDGLRRNPWDEAECGHHYARALSSWSLLNAFSGFAYAAPEKSLRFRPAAGAKDFRCFFASGTAWGSYRQQREDGELEASVQVEGGALEIATLRIPAGGRKLRRAPAGAQLSVENGLASIRLSRPARLAGGDQLSIALGG